MQKCKPRKNRKGQVRRPHRTQKGRLEVGLAQGSEAGTGGGRTGASTEKAGRLGSSSPLQRQWQGKDESQKAPMTWYLEKVRESFTATGQNGPQGFKQSEPSTRK